MKINEITGIHKSFDTNRMHCTITGNSNRLFFVGKLKEENNEDWATNLFYKDKSVVELTVDIIDSNNVRLNYINSSISGSGWGRELLIAAFEYLKIHGYKTAIGYIENNNIASKSMMNRVGGVKTKESTYGSYYTVDLVKY